MLPLKSLSHSLSPNKTYDAVNWTEKHEEHAQRAKSIEYYTVGWICALQEEYESACRMLDEELDDPEELEESDDNTYTFGRVGVHYVVIGCLPAGRYGTNSAARVARDMARSFPGLRFGLMVGIGGGLPTAENDIRLGDVVVSMPNGTSGGVVQYDLGKRLPNDFFQRTGHLNAPPNKLLGVITEIRKRYNDPRKPDTISEHLQQMNDMPDYRRPKHDHLYRADYLHQGSQNCDMCDASHLVQRPDRTGRAVRVHYGTIASGNSLIKDAAMRDEFAKSDTHPLCFEMEAAGNMNSLPCLLIRGICDYSDSHKNDDWHKYAALAAAAYAKELLLVLKKSKVTAIPTWVDEVQTSIAHVSRDVRELQSASDEELLHRWLSPPDASTNFNTAKGSLEPGTGTWLLNNQSYKRWKYNSNLPIWLYGVPGSGKTVLSSLVIEDCARITSSPDVSLLYFYFDFADADKCTYEAMMRSLLWQFAKQGSDMRKVLQDLFMSCNGGQSQPSQDKLSAAFGEMITDKKDIYIIIDALDECIERDSIMWFIQKCTTWHKEKLHLCVSSRQEKDIDEYLQPIVGYQGGIKLDKERVNAGIRHYIRRRLQVEKGLGRWRKMPNMQKKIESDIMGKSDGMFRWAVCQLNSVRECLDLPMLQERLATLPRTLEETYFRIISSILDHHKSYALKILQWLVHAVRPLTIEELVDVIAVRLEGDELAFNPQNLLIDINDILSICSSLITIEKTNQGRLVRLSHVSVKDYLMSGHAQSILKDTMAEETANAAIASVCLKYIFQLDSDGCARNKLIQSFPLMIYAVKHWPKHAYAAGERPDSLLQLIEELLLVRKTAFCNWACLYEAKVPSGKQIWEDSLPLFYASLTGLARSVGVMLNKGINPNLCCGNSETPLQVASYQGHIGVVQKLLDKNADPNLTGGSRGTALQIASHRGYEDIARHLVRGGADPNLICGTLKSPLLEALSLAQEQTAIILIDNGANPNDWCEEYGSALQVALINDIAPAVQRLLDSGADPNTTDGPHGTALQIVSDRGNEQVVQKLIEKGANPNFYEEGSESPLQKVLYLSHAQLVELLLNAGAKANPQICGAALERAAYDGRLQMVRTLVTAGPSIGLCKEHYGVALWLASSEGHEQIVHLLFDKASASIGYLDLAIEWATRKKNYGVVDLLRQRSSQN